MEKTFREAEKRMKKEIGYLEEAKGSVWYPYLLEPLFTVAEKVDAIIDYLGLEMERKEVTKPSVIAKVKKK